LCFFDKQGKAVAATSNLFTRPRCRSEFFFFFFLQHSEKQSMDLFELIFNVAGFSTSVAEDEMEQPTSYQEEPSLPMIYCVIA
jgi:hypothetical protein